MSTDEWTKEVPKKSGLYKGIIGGVPCLIIVNMDLYAGGYVRFVTKGISFTPQHEVWARIEAVEYWSRVPIEFSNIPD